MSIATKTTTAAPTRTRFWVIVFAVTLAIITYIDRVCISQAAPEIQRDLGISKEQMGWVFSVFYLAYGLFEIPGGWMGDRFGPRRALMRVVVLWSFFTAATGWTWNWMSMLVCRFCFGMGEAGCFPNVAKIFTLWLSPEGRVRAQGIMWLSARWGGAFTPVLVMWVLQYSNWRWAFFWFGLLGALWAVVFYRWFRDDPREHPAVNAAELALIEAGRSPVQAHGPVPWKQLMTSRTVWLLWLQYFGICYGWHFYVTWLPTYLQEARHVDPLKGAWLSCLPLFIGGLGSLFSGFIAVPLARWVGGTARARRLLAFSGLAGAGALILLSTHIQSPVLAMVALGMASFCNDLSMPGSWATCMDIGGRYVGSLSGSMNMMGQFGAMVAPVAIPFILRQTGNSWEATFWAGTAAYWIAAACWLWIDPVTPLEEQGRAEVVVANREV